MYVAGGVTKFDFSRGYQNNILQNKENQKNAIFALHFIIKQCFILKDGLYSGYLLSFSSAHKCASVY